MFGKNDDLRIYACMKRNRIESFKIRILDMIREHVVCEKALFNEPDNNIFGYKNGIYCGVLSITFSDDEYQVVYDFDVRIDAVNDNLYKFSIRGFDKDWQQLDCNLSIRNNGYNFLEKIIKIFTDEVNFTQR